MTKINNTFLKFLFLCIFSVGIFSTTSAQLVGGNGNGQAPPSAVEPASISDGGFSGNVSLFSGTYNTSQILGSVSCPSGLNYTATLSNSSTFSSGDNLPQTTGIPYGEGWSVDIPSISVSVEDYSKYTVGQRDEFSDPSNTYSWHDEQAPDFYNEENGCTASKEGKLHWFAPQLNIPGVASGRLVYKYKQNNKHYFVLHTFEDYVEAIFTGTDWEIITSDGTFYRLAPVVISHRQASNQRVQNGCFDAPNGGALKDLVLPKSEIMTWYVTKISNKNMVGQITFKYEKFGAFDFFKVYSQDLFHQYISTEWLNNNSLPGHLSPKLMQVHRDVFLKEITGCSEKLKFDYESIGIAGAVNLIDINAPNAIRKDSLYTGQVIGDWGGDNGYTDWYRYLHGKHRDHPFRNSSSLIDPSNPYKVKPIGGGIEPYYYREPVGNNTHTYFNHSYFESPRLNNNIFPGDLYEIKTNRLIIPNGVINKKV